MATENSSQPKTQLTSAQEEAIFYHDGPLLIIAGPGSGKTEVISQRTAYLISSGKAAPQNLLVTTFTEKAALELKDRIQSKLKNENVELMQVSTIHSLCYTLLNEFRSKSPFPKGFWVLDEAAQLLFIYSQRKELGLGKVMKGRESDFYASALRAFNLATEELVKPEEFISYCEKNLNSADKDSQAFWEEQLLIAHAYKNYLDLLMETNATDFSSLQKHTLQMLQENKDILKTIQKRYTHVLIDEYQDTNTVQDMILNLIAEPEMNIAVVGDDDQSIYRFRGATVKNILEFPEKYKPIKTVKLEDNFRSVEPIIIHSSRLIVCNECRSEKSLRCIRKEWKNDILYVHEKTAADEADSVVKIIRKLKLEGTITHYRDVAILLRSVKSYADPYKESLDKYNIPYIVHRDGGFFERQEISDIYNLFLFLSAPKPWGDKFIRCQLLDLSKKTEKKLEKFKKDITSLQNQKDIKSIGITRKKDREKLLALIELKKKVQQRKNQSILEIFYDLQRLSGYFSRMEKENNKEAVKNIGIFTRIISEFDEYRGTNVIYPFISYLKLLKQSGLDSFTEPTQDAIQVMTVHQAKGLEFPVVVIGAAMEGRFPTRRRREKYEIPYELRTSGQPEVEDPHIVDERKLFYVAASRARDLLIIGSSDVVNKRGGGPSRFINELLGKNTKGAIQRSQKILNSPIYVKHLDKSSEEPRLRITYSHISYYLQCPLRYKYFVIDGLKPPISSYFYFGASVHRALELIHKDILAGKKVKLNKIPDYVDKTWLMPEKLKGEKEKQKKKEAVNQIKNYMEKQMPSRPDLFSAEKPFAFELEGAVVRGKIDLIRNGNNDSKEIVDFKTTRSKASSIEQYDHQMDIYALGAEKGLNLNISDRSLYFLEDNKPQTIDWDEGKRKTAESNLSSWIQKIKNQEFEPRIEFCPFCDEFKEICPYFKK
ncbi:MAG: ATP-dependent helicase [Candidatus Aminicenantes bacterium]|nr:ATP-dependent helicase [Candidatus Aminicenantes bacterium]